MTPYDTPARRRARRKSETPNIQKVGRCFQAYADIEGRRLRIAYPSLDQAKAQVNEWGEDHEGLPRYEIPALPERECGFCGARSGLIVRYASQSGRGLVCPECRLKAGPFLRFERG